MGFGQFLGKQFIDVIDWVDVPDVLAIRYPMRDREIQNGAKLTVREAQAAAFLNEGRMADVFGPGLHTLTTATLPVLTNLANWDKAFASPFKSDVYFFSLREQIDRKWGVAQPITVRDRDFGAIRVRAFGRYAFQVADVQTFWRSLVGNLERYTVDQVEPQLRAAIVTALASRLGAGEIAFLDLAREQASLSAALKDELTAVFANYGLRLTAFLVESLSLPEEVQAHLDKAASMRAVGDLGQYGRFQAADAIQAAAENEGGLAGLGAGAAAGMAIGQAMGLGGGGASQAAGLRAKTRSP